MQSPHAAAPWNYENEQLLKKPSLQWNAARR
jgi:hypothetical protein